MKLTEQQRETIKKLVTSDFNMALPHMINQTIEDIEKEIQENNPDFLLRNDESTITIKTQMIFIIVSSKWAEFLNVSNENKLLN